MLVDLSQYSMAAACVELVKATPFESLCWSLDQVPWRKDAACSGGNTGMFFPERGESTKPAKAICATCPVRTECLEYALDTYQCFGIWGGTSERERRRIRKARGLPELEAA